ncbi:hypothetical protein QZN06_18415 [Burkholderia multivorans]|nr:hypothetical protein [Burkholderia multivorans]MDN8010561.1 hypothetical protein [Burkholderia multivorans]
MTDRSSEAILRRIDNGSVNGIVEFDTGLPNRFAFFNASEKNQD